MLTRMVEIRDNAWWWQLQDRDAVVDWKLRHITTGARYTVLCTARKEIKEVGDRVESVAIRLYTVHVNTALSEIYYSLCRN